MRFDIAIVPSLSARKWWRQKKNMYREKMDMATQRLTVLEICTNVRPDKSILPWISRFWLESHSLTVRHKIFTLNWHLRQFFCALVEGQNCVFEKKNNPKWIGKFRVNAWLDLTNFWFWFLGWSSLVCTKKRNLRSWFYRTIK